MSPQAADWSYQNIWQVKSTDPSGGKNSVKIDGGRCICHGRTKEAVFLAFLTHSKVAWSLQGFGRASV